MARREARGLRDWKLAKALILRHLNEADIVGRERWQEIERLYHLALEDEESRRAEFLEQSCGGDEALRREVESLLAYEKPTETFMEAPSLGGQH